MTTPNPVPSRALINALRGIALGTSCSVVLLAEERRRRINLARSAVDNARKLHVVSGRRSSAGLAESLNAWERGLSDNYDDVIARSAGPHAGSAPRRRRKTRRPDTGPDRGSGNSPTDTTNYTASVIETSDPTVAILTDRKPNLVQMPPIKVDHLDGFLTALRSVPIEHQAKHPSNDAPRGFEDGPLYSMRKRTPDPAINTGGAFDFLAEREVSITLGYDSRVAQVDAKSRRSQRAQARRAQRLETWNTLVSELEDPALSVSEIQLRLDRATELFDNWVTLRSELRAEPSFSDSRLEDQVLAMLKLSATSAESSHLQKVLGAFVLAAGYDCVPTLTKFLPWLSREHNLEGLRASLQSLVEVRHSQSGSGQGRKINYILRVMRRMPSREDWPDLKCFYSDLLKVGLFETLPVSLEHEYAIRRQMFLTANRVYSAGSLELMKSELEHMRRLKPDFVEVDSKLQCARFWQDARRDDWEAIAHRLSQLHDQIPGWDKATKRDLETTLTGVVDIITKSKPAEELDRIIRLFVTEYGIALQERWMYNILHLYGRRQDSESTISWLEFCKEHGTLVSDESHQNLWSSCLQFWGYSGVVVQSFQKQGLVREGQYREQVCGSVSAAQEGGKVYHSLCCALRKEDWQGLCDTYDRAFADDKLPFSARCFGLYIKARLNLSQGTLEPVVKDLQAAQAGGRDVTKAVSALLTDRLDDGADPNEVLRNALRHGVRVHDAVYNKAAQNFLANGDFARAVEVCEVAAAQNGGGMLAYNDRNFSNLVFAYTGARHYTELGSLLSQFMSSEWMWWKGGRICRDSIKFAMTTTAQRAEGEPLKAHGKATIWLQEALDHARGSRPSESVRLAVRSEVMKAARLKEGGVSTSSLLEVKMRSESCA